MATTTLDFMIDDVRIKIGDLDSSSYRYLDEWILKALVGAIEKFQKYSNNKYFVDRDSYEAYRNPNLQYAFLTPESQGVIESSDIPILVLFASVIILEGSLQNSAWNLASWRDNEISYSNLESGRTRKDILNDLRKELDDMIKPPSKRLAWPITYPLPGYKNNRFENDTES